MSYILSTKYARKDDSDFIVAIARAIYCDWYTSYMEERGKSFRGEITEQVPETQRWAFRKAREFADALVALFQSKFAKPGVTATLDDMLSVWRIAAESAEHTDREPTEENLGWYAAMQAMGHGVGLDYCGVELGYHLPYLDSMPTMSAKEIKNKRARDPEYDAIMRAYDPAPEQVSRKP